MSFFATERAKIKTVTSAVLDEELDRISRLCTVPESAL